MEGKTGETAKHCHIQVVTHRFFWAGIHTISSHTAESLQLRPESVIGHGAPLKFKTSFDGRPRPEGTQT